MKDSSLRVSPGSSGIVIDVQTFTREGLEKDARSKAIEKAKLTKVRANLDEALRIRREVLMQALTVHLCGQEVVRAPDAAGFSLKKGEKITEDYFKGIGSFECGLISSPKMKK